jgi:hypothetical protein
VAKAEAFQPEHVCSHCEGIHYGTPRGECPYICKRCGKDIRPDIVDRCSCTPVASSAAPSERERSEKFIREAASHLRVALVQATPNDDQIIMGHVRQALNMLEAVCEAARAAAPQNGDLEFAKELGIQYCADLVEHGEPWEVPAEPEPLYFETFREAVKEYIEQLSKECDRLAAAPPALGRWIPVSERLPDASGRFLVVLRSGNVVFMRDFYLGDAHMKGDWGRNVTCWQPLPSPPVRDFGASAPAQTCTCKSIPDLPCLLHGAPAQETKK